MSILFSVLLFLFPASICRFLAIVFRCKNVNIGKGCRVGFSIVKCDKLELADGSVIGHLNFISVRNLQIGGGKIKHMNLIKGPVSVVLEKESWIHSLNKITCASTKIYKPISFTMKAYAAIIQNHLFDLTDSITIGENSIFAGANSQVWTHSFIMGSERHVRMDGEVIIGKKCYIGSQCVICAGSHICDYSVIGANTTITKDITEPGLYVSQAVRKIDYNPDEAIRKLQNEVAKNVYSKTFQS